MKIIIWAEILFLCLSFNVKTASARESYWAEYHIELSELKDEQVKVLEESIRQLRMLEPNDLKVNKKVHRRLSRFKELYGFPFNGKDLSHWLLSRIKSISYHNPWTAAVNQNRGDFILGDFFFTKMSRVERLYSLIHEARHSDGDGYPHIKCPKGFKYISSRQPDMDLENELTCDNDDKGAYAFQAAFLFELFSYGIFDQKETGLLYNSSISRLVQ